MSDIKWGYARVSSVGQSLDVQIAALRAAGVPEDNILSEKVSGSSADRPQLKLLQQFARKGSTVIITKLDRLGRSLNDLSSIVAGFEAKGVAFTVLDQSIDTSTPTGKLMFGMLSSFAEFELSLRAERQMVGIAAAKAKGRKFGRTATISPDAVADAYKEHMTIGKTAKAMGISKSSVHRLLKAEA